MRQAFLMICAALLASVVSAAAAPDEELLGKSKGYPVGTRSTWFFDEGTRVGSFSHLDTLLPHHTLAKPANPQPLRRAAGEFNVDYKFDGRVNSLDDFLAHQRVTGLVMIKDGEILAERYQYDRQPTDRLVSHSMAKSIVSLAVGIALSEGKIGSLDDRVSKYVPALAGSAYGETAIRNLLRMSSGVAFSEVYDGHDDAARFWKLRTAQGSVAALRAFTDREAEQGSRFHYASSETVVLGLLLREVTAMTLSDYVAARLWQPLGAEADATWAIASAKDGLESAAGNFNAVLRDYGRLGVLLANDGAVGGKQIVPKDFLLDATDWRRQPEAFAPMRATPYFGYGYQFWLFPGEKRRFALLGVYGQSIFVDPALKLVMVITAVAHNASVGKESLARERNALWRGLIAKYGSW
jgi:CubicO group peptidase (beta-lactamase class C family)